MLAFAGRALAHGVIILTVGAGVLVWIVTVLEAAEARTRDETT